MDLVLLVLNCFSSLDDTLYYTSYRWFLYLKHNFSLYLGWTVVIMLFSMCRLYCTPNTCHRSIPEPLQIYGIGQIR